MSADDDATLLRACRAGDQEAWETLVRRYQRLIYTIPRRAGLNEDQAADVFQRVCMLLLEHLERIEQPERLVAWLSTTARRESWRLLRRERVMTTAPHSEREDDLAQLPDTDLLPDEVLERIERQHMVRAALNSLDQRCRGLLVMLFYQAEPPPYAEVAARLGVPEGSIGPTRARCLQKLQKLLEQRDF